MSIYGQKTTQEYASKFYVDTQDDQRLQRSGGEMNGNLDMNNYKKNITVR